MKSAGHLGFWSVFSIAAGAMISSGLFVLPGLAFAEAGPAVILSYALGAVLMIPAVLCHAELASAIPKAGARFVFIERTLGTFAGTFAGLAGWFAIALKSAFALVGIGAFAQLVWPDVSIWVVKGIALVGCVVFVGFNCLTVKGVGRAQVFMVGGLLVLMVGFLGWGMASDSFRLGHFAGFAERGFLRIAATAGLVMVSFGGLTATADITGEVRRGARVVPLGMLTALGVVGVVYVAAVTVVVGVTPPGSLAGHLTPVSLAAETFAGRAGAIVLAAGAMLAFITTANGGILEASRSPMAMAHDGLLPGFFRQRSTRFGTPLVSVLTTGLFMVAVIAALSIENLVKVASTMLLLLYVLACLAVVVMRTSRLQNYRPLFRVPLVPWLPMAGVAAYLLLVIDMGPVPLLTTAAFAAGGGVWYWLYIRPRIDRESALVYLVRRIVARDMYRADLDEELKQIAIARDGIVHDRFDQIIQDCPILDLTERTSVEDFFGRIADALAHRLEVAESALLEKFHNREADSTTVIQPGLAIPHVVIEGRGLFAMMLVRCREGIVFDADRPPVHTAFVLVGSPDERNYHLRALMAIAHIVQEPDFLDRWFAATTTEALRDLVLMSSRQRDGHHHE